MQMHSMKKPAPLTHKLSVNLSRLLRHGVLLLLMLAAGLAMADESAVQTLDQLLEKVKQHQSAEKALYQQRERDFLQQRNQQKQLVEQAKARFLHMQKQNNPLQQQADANEAALKRMRQELDEHVRELGDIYSIYSEFAGDFMARMNDSLVRSQLPQRAEQLQAMQAQDALPTIDDMRALMLLLQQEMTEAGKISHYQAEVTHTDGSQQVQPVSRIGSFTMISEGQLLQNIPASGELLMQQRQPAGFAGQAQAFTRADQAILPMIIDPTRGTLLGLLDQSPGLAERIRQGAAVGYVIIALGIAGLLLAAYRLLYLGLVWLKVRRQRQHPEQAQANNPLGRILMQAKVLQHADEETLQQRLNEAVLKELPRLEQGQSLIKLMAAIAPLLGLLGTVVGMIATFQSISLFGSGDPRLMAGGISQALVTTVQGLIVAIPLLFCHNLVSSFSRSLVQVLDEQSAGILADALEQQRSRGGEHE